MAHEVLGPLLTYQFFATCVVITALLTLTKKMGRASDKIGHFFGYPWFQAFVLAPLNLIFGFLFGLIPNWLQAPTITDRLILGVIAGFISNFMYTVLKKRVAVLSGVNLDDFTDEDGSFKFWRKKITTTDGVKEVTVVEKAGPVVIPVEIKPDETKESK